MDTHIRLFPPTWILETLTKLFQWLIRTTSVLLNGISTYRLTYCALFFARPVGFFFFSCLSTLGHWPLTLPARARDP